MLGYALGYCLLAITIQLGLTGRLNPWALFFLLLAVRLSYPLLAAAAQPAATAYIADVTDRISRARGMALIGIAAGVGTVLGPLVGGLLVARGPAFPLYVAALLTASGALLTFSMLREPSRQPSGPSPARLMFSDSRIFPYLAGYCLIILVLTGIQTITAFYVEDLFNLSGPESVIGATSLAFLTMGGAMIFFQAVVLQACKIAPKVLLRTGFLLFGLALVVLSFAGNLAMLNVAYGGIGLSFSMIMSGLNAAASLSVEDHQQGAVAGLLSAAPILGMVLGPIIATVLYGIDLNWPLWFGAVIAIGTGVYFFFVPVPEPATDG